MSEEAGVADRFLICKRRGRLKPAIKICEDDSTKYTLTYHRMKGPDLKLVSGDDGAVLAISYLKSFSKCYHIGVGPDETRMEWTDFHYKFGKREPTFDWTDGKTYTIARVSNVPGKSTWEKIKDPWHFSVRDSEGNLLASYYTHKEDGRLMEIFQVAGGMSQAFEQAVLLGIWSWKEEMRRAG